MTHAAAAARYLKGPDGKPLIAWDRIVDNRNPPPKTEIRPDKLERKAEVSVKVAELDDADEVEVPDLCEQVPELPDIPEKPEVAELPEEREAADFPEMPETDDLPKYKIVKYEGAQRYVIIVLCEKSTQDDVLLEWCRVHNALLWTSEGEMTHSIARRLVELIVKLGMPVVIVYVSDLDFKGQDMPVSMARKLQWMLADERADGREPPEVFLVPAAITRDQVIRFHLPDEKIPDSKKFIVNKETLYVNTMTGAV